MEHKKTRQAHDLTGCFYQQHTQQLEMYYTMKRPDLLLIIERKDGETRMGGSHDGDQLAAVNLMLDVIAESIGVDSQKLLAAVAALLRTGKGHAEEPKRVGTTRIPGRGRIQ